MTWNYRVIRHENPSIENPSGVSYCIHQCFYNNGGAAIPHSWNTEPVPVIADTRTGLFWVLAVMTEAVAKPVLEVCDDKLVEVEPVRELTDDLKKAVAANKEFAEGMA